MKLQGNIEIVVFNLNSAKLSKSICQVKMGSSQALIVCEMVLFDLDLSYSMKMSLFINAETLFINAETQEEKRLQ